MKEMPFWLARGPKMTGTAAGNGAARAAGRRGRRQRKVEVFMVVTKSVEGWDVQGGMLVVGLDG